LGLAIATISGCTSQRAIEAARERGAQAGREEGRSAGDAAGFTAAALPAEKESYRDTLNQLYCSGEYRRDPFYTLAVPPSFFIIGFALQWLAFYVPRRAGYLLDIDWIVLPKEMTAVDLKKLSVPPPMNPKQLKPPGAGTLVILSLILLPVVGCKDPELEAWKQGYDANQGPSYQDGWQQGAARGESEGKKLGRAAAQNAAETGRALQLYSTLAFWALMFGVLIGACSQYTILVCCRLSGRLPELLTVAFVPAMKSSLSYAVLEQRRQLMIWWDEEIRKVAATRELKVTQMLAAKQVWTRKLKAISSLEDFSQARLLDLAKKELSQILSASEQRATRAINLERGGPKASLQYRYYCPHCKKGIGYKAEKAGKSVNCPHKECRRPVTLPLRPSNGVDAPPTILADEN
jgi:hypothetical protein